MLFDVVNYLKPSNLQTTSNNLKLQTLKLSQTFKPSNYLKPSNLFKLISSYLCLFEILYHIKYF